MHPQTGFWPILTHDDDLFLDLLDDFLDSTPTPQILATGASLNAEQWFAEPLPADTDEDPVLLDPRTGIRLGEAT